MSAQHDPAFVVRLSDFAEHSQIATLYTRSAGLVRLIAKGVRRGTRQRFATGLDLLEQGEAGYSLSRQAGALGTLAEWVQRDLHAPLRARLATLYAASYAAEALVALSVEEDPHPTLFDALVQLLSDLDAAAGSDAALARARTLPLLTRFVETLAGEAGFAPNLESCVDCGRIRPAERPAFFTARGGGLVCRACADRFPDRRKFPAGAFAAEVADDQRWRLLDHHLSQLCGHPFRTTEALTRALEPRPDR